MSNFPASGSVSARCLTFGLAMLLLTAPPVSAFCGLQSCPKPAGSGEAPTLEVGVRTRAVAFDIEGNEGRYLVTAPRLFVRRLGFALGAEVPLTHLWNGSSTVAGFSNPVLMANYSRRVSYSWSAELGIQWELPLGHQAGGLAGDHNMLLPWIGLRRDLGHAWYATGMVGVSAAVEDAAATVDTAGGSAHTASFPILAKSTHAGEDHGTGSTPVLVNPHADREAQARISVGWVRGRGALEGFVLSQTDLTSAATGTYVRAGASYEWSLMRFTGLQVIGDIPVTTSRRNEAEVGVTIKTGW